MQSSQINGYFHTLRDHYYTVACPRSSVWKCSSLITYVFYTALQLCQ